MSYKGIQKYGKFYFNLVLVRLSYQVVEYLYHNAVVRKETARVGCLFECRIIPLHSYWQSSSFSEVKHNWNVVTEIVNTSHITQSMKVDCPLTIQMPL